MKRLVFPAVFFFLNIFLVPLILAADGVENPPQKIVSLHLEKANLTQVIGVLAKIGEFNLIFDESPTVPITIHLKNIELREALDLILKAGGLFYQKINNCFVISRDKILRPGFLKKKVFNLNYLSSEELINLIKPFLKENEILTADGQNQKVVVAADETVLQEIEELVKNLDTPPQQVVLEAKIIEVSSDALRNLGPSWPQKINFNLSLEETSGKNWLAVWDPIKFQAGLNLLEQKGLSRVLASPRLMVLNNREASILIGDRIPYQVTTISPSGALSSKVEFVEAGIKLKMTPRINDNQEITVLINPEVSYVYNWKGASSEIPWVKTRETKTVVRVKNGQTIFLAGLLSEDEKESLSRLPILGEFPILGGLFFTSKRKDKVKSEVVISVTPRII